MPKQEFESPFEILKSKEGLIMILKLGQLTKYHVKKIFIEKCAENMHQTLVPDLYLILLHSLKYRKSIQETL